MADVYKTARQKATALLVENIGVLAKRLASTRSWHEAVATIASALTPEYGSEKAADIALHLADWSADAAFMHALHLFPERFTTEEIQAGVQAFLIHVPNHIAAAAHLSGWPIRDVFGVGLNLDE
jgi:hypothetical protein